MANPLNQEKVKKYKVLRLLNIMDYERVEKEFYTFIRNKRDEINGLNIPEKKKVELYQLIKEYLQRYAQIRLNSLEIQVGKIYLNEIQKNLDTILKNIISEAKKRLSNLEEVTLKQKANKKFLPFKGYTSFSKN